MKRRDLLKRVLALPVRTIVSVPSRHSRGGVREFYSEADYWWPDPGDPAGRYVNRDGESNPECFNRHRKRLMRLSCIVGFLAGEYLRSAGPAVLERLCDHLEAWFADEENAMLPHLEYAQSIRGSSCGRNYGIIDTIHLAEAALAVLKLRENMPRKLVGKLVSWFERYLDWLCTSALGIAERGTLNNHAVCWYLQAAAFAHLTEQKALLDEFRQDFETRLLGQISADGSLPEELKRTKPYSYELFTLEVLAGLAALLSTPRYNAFLRRRGQGGTVFDAVRFMSPYIENKALWPHPADIKYFDYWPVRQNALSLADAFCGQPDFARLWKQLPDYRLKFELIRNYPVRTVALWIV